VSLAVVGALPISASAIERMGIHIAARIESIDEASRHTGPSADALIATTTSLHEDVVSQLASAAQALNAHAVAVIYGFGTAEAVELARLSGFELFRSTEGQTNSASIISKLAQAVVKARQVNDAERRLWLRTQRRFDEATLASLSGLSTTVKCECPRHLSELIMQLSAFERYSDECVSRSPADALLHRHLGDAANRAAELLETALRHPARRRAGRGRASAEVGLGRQSPASGWVALWRSASSTRDARRRARPFHFTTAHCAETADATVAARGFASPLATPAFDTPPARSTNADRSSSTDAARLSGAPSTPTSAAWLRCR
jgi:hypothetical protein